MGELFDVTYEQYIGPPTTALLFVPFTLLPFWLSVRFYRMLVLVAMGWAIVWTAGVSGRRSFAMLCGILCVLTWQPLTISVGLGQLDGLMMLGVAGALVASQRENYGGVGLFSAGAALLKVSPGLILIGLLRRSWRPLWAALLSGILLLGFLFIVGMLDDVVIFMRDIAPRLGAGTTYIQNISLGATLARIADGGSGSEGYLVPLGPWRLIAPGVVVAMIAFRWVSPLRHTVWAVSELLVLGLIAGPITWDHYLIWLIPVLQLLAARGDRRVQLGVAIVALLCALPTIYDPARVWYHTLKPVALLGLLALLWWHDHADVAAADTNDATKTVQVGCA